MKSTDAPVKQIVPFGANGPRDAITATTPSGSNQASYDQGFPPITMTLKSAGGLPPKGQDMNQILYEGSTFDRYFAAGGSYPYDASFASGIGGYPLGARVLNSVKSGFWVNTIEDNTANPENTTAALTGWVPQESPGITTISGLSSSSLTLNSVQASKSRLVLNGSLTANINIVVPAWVKIWQVVNNTTGSFTVTIKTPSGTGVAMAAGTTHYVIGDGTNIIEDLGSAAFRTVGIGSNQVPDMNSFQSGQGWQKLPGGTIIQQGTALAGRLGTPATIVLPVSFTDTSIAQVVAGYDNPASGVSLIPAFATRVNSGGASFDLMHSSSTTANIYCRWIAVGR